MPPLAPSAGSSCCPAAEEGERLRLLTPLEGREEDGEPRAESDGPDDEAEEDEDEEDEEDGLGEGGLDEEADDEA